MPLLFSSPSLFSQSSDPNGSLSQSLVSASGFTDVPDGSFQFALGNLHHVLIHNDAHAYKPRVDSKIKSALEDSIRIFAYPNPFVYQVEVVFEDFEVHIGDLYQYSVFDSAGNTIKTGRLRTASKKLNFYGVSPGVYFVTIFKNNTVIKSIKLLKKNS